MREIILNTAIKHFALISSILGQEQLDKLISKFVQHIKSSKFDLDINESVKLFTEFYNIFSDDYNLFEEPELAYHTYNVSFDKIYSEIVFQFDLNDRIYLILLIIDFYFEVFPEKTEEKKFLEITANRLGISTNEYNNCLQFVTLEDTDTSEINEDIIIFKPLSAKIEDLEGSWIEQNKPEELKVINEIEIDQLNCKLYVLFFRRLKSYVLKYQNYKELVIDDNKLDSGKFIILEPGDEISYKNIVILNYSGIKTRFIKNKMSSDLSLLVNNVSFSETNDKNALRNFYTYEDTGRLIGILGKKGVGKSTLLELIAGRISPVSGEIYINGYNLNTNKYLLKSLIGFVPEEDMLFDELTVYDNLELTARLFYSKLTAKEREAKVYRTLEILDLYEVRNRVVGSILGKSIQPAQRRLLNIALELIREPKILLVDNAIYGLGSAESSKILKILNDYTFGGNLVITTLSQTSSQAFRLFDKLWIIDESGYPVFNGDTNEAPDYFKFNLKITGLSDFSKKCTPEYILELIDFRNTDSSGKIGKRKVNPVEWHQIYLEKKDKKLFQTNPQKIPLPTNYINAPNLETQFKIFSLRNFKVKFSNSQKLLFSVLAGPFIAFILSVILKKSVDGQYIFYMNDNIPLYLFASSIISVLLGLFISSKEILTEKNIHSKEVYLEFSGFSYINSKITFLFIIGAFQTFLYVLTGNGILEIKGMLISHWLILYSACCFGIMIGLIFSALHSNLSTLYERTIPLFIALQILLGGGIVTYKDLSLDKSPYVPVIGDLMVSKWAYEALMVEQFEKNDYAKLVYNDEKAVSNSKYYTFSLIPELQKTLNLISESKLKKDSLNFSIRLINNGIQTFYEEGEVFQFEFLDKLNMTDFSDKILSETQDYLTYLDLFYYNKYESSVLKRDLHLTFLNDSLGKDYLTKLKNKHYNKRIEEIVMNKAETNKWRMFNKKIFQLSDPIYQNPQSDKLRSIMFLPEKKFRGQTIDTIWFNITIIWLFTLLLYIIMVANIPEQISGISINNFQFFKK